MGAHTTEMHISQLPDQIATRFQRVFLCFWGRAIRCDKCQHCITIVEGTRSGKSKMAAYNNEMHISWLPDQLATRFQRLYLSFRGRATRWDKCQHFITQGEGTGSGKFEMAAYYTEMHISQLPDLMAARFQRLCLCFRGRALQWDNSQYCTTKSGRNRKWKIQESGQYH